MPARSPSPAAASTRRGRRRRRAARSVGGDRPRPRAGHACIGVADRYRTVTGFEVTPVVGVVPPDLPLVAQPGRGRRLVRGAARLRPRSRQPAARAPPNSAGATRHYFEIDWDGRRIWGATAAMIVNLSRRAQHESSTRPTGATAPGMNRLLAALDADRARARFVGGAVRDALLGLPVERRRPRHPHRARRGRPPPRGGADQGGPDRHRPRHGHRRHRRARVVEVTTLRRDVATDGRRATVAFTDDWREDAARRDFTINALYADPLSGEIFDYFGGVADLAAAPRPLHRRAAAAHRRGPSAHPALLPLPRPLRQRRARRRRARRLHRARQRPHGPVARTHRRRIAEAARPARSVADRGADARARHPRARSCPKSPPTPPRARRAGRGRARSAASRPTRSAASPLLLPRDPALAEKVAARLKLSNRARKRLACAAEDDLAANPRALAYRAG